MKLNHFMVLIFATLLLVVGCSEKGKQSQSGQSSGLRPAYTIIFSYEINDIDGYREYTDNHLPQMAQYGGRFLAESSSPIMIEGDPPRGKFILLQKWPDINALEKWYNSGEYILLKKIQRRAMRVDIGILNSATLSDELADINHDRAAPQAAYAIMEIKNIIDQSSFNKYMTGRLVSMEKHGVRFLAQQKGIESQEGIFASTKYYILMQWPDINTFNKWYDSDDYKPWRQLLHDAVDFNLYLINSTDMRPELNW